MTFASKDQLRLNHASKGPPICSSGIETYNIVTDANCDSCHTTHAWTPAHVDHADVIGSCVSCHDGTAATGQPGTHMPTTSYCEGCHQTTDWWTVDMNASAHQYVVGTCNSCHDGITARGKPPSHSPTGALDCGDSGCHSTSTFVK